MKPRPHEDLITVVIGNLYSNNTIFECINKKRKKEEKPHSCALGFIWYGNDWHTHTSIYI